MVCLYIEIHFLSYDTKKSSIILLIFSCPELSISLLCRVLILWGFYNFDFSQNILNTLFCQMYFDRVLKLSTLNWIQWKIHFGAMEKK